MDTDKTHQADKFDFWKKQAPKAIYFSDFHQVSIYWCPLALLFIITVNVLSPVGTKTQLYKPEMTRVIYEDVDAMTSLLRDERTTAKQGEQK